MLTGFCCRLVKWLPMFRNTAMPPRKGSNTTLGLLNPEDGGNTLLRNVCDHLPVNTLSEPQMLQFEDILRQVSVPF